MNEKKILCKKKEREKKHAIYYKNEIWSDAEQKYDTDKYKYIKILKILKKCKHYIYEMYFILKINTNTLVTQLNRSAINLLETVVMRWIA